MNTPTSMQKTFRRTVLASAVALTAGWGAMAQADTDTHTTSFDASAEVIANCVVAAGAMSFNGYDPVGTNAALDLDQHSDIRVTCTNGMEGVNIGLAYSGTMSSPGGEGQHLTYSLYSNDARDAAWGDTTTVTVDADGTEQTHTVYGRVPQDQPTAFLGTHTETVNVTVSW